MNLLNISEAAKLLGISPSTLRRMESDGIVEKYGLKVIYTPGGQRRYMFDEIQQLYTQQGFSGQLGFGQYPVLLIRDFTLAFTDPNSKLTIQLNGQIEATKQMLETAVAKGVPVIFTKTIYDPTQAFSLLWGQKFSSLQVLDRNGVWVKIHPDLAEFTYDMVNATVYINDFFRSPLEEFLNQRGIDTIILAGTTTSGSIRATAVEALQRGYHVIIPKEAVGDRSESLHSSTLLDLNARYADVLKLEEVLKYLKTINKNKNQAQL
ncbi:nicotinamidase-like amidase [Schinkia azotoformans MEV2011]|uniref:Nicotinamidase-like amidase n=1 Tax=Schinkia azotoformans MEV2011 TaxID=1348973 RepID=A0A072NSD1_SCHAZ|nr:isochorismatase family protein [Schinkia azotoformans]KEF36100.1 nicotinamidase-like amidase [Schinkia azotoformans MEV2011]MEC1695508.1 isochorismatase family protein [Schinkia azotoformans]MEC1718697.1 isochorismatase family protein [Schinkia azotoformans]MEC1727157.1 isochorismatase family protein [Schinkia azotoformans]MEC1743768.1 isochorismatase family protein [Schinkia azotoformans]